jgi:hypothetical protein
MSDSLAIASVTTTLRNLLQEGFDTDGTNVQVTTRPPDKVQAAANSNTVNLFLYQATVNPHWRSMDVPWRVKPGETGRTPLPLDLYYLITAHYGDSEDGVDTNTDTNRLLGSHRLLGQAMSILHDHAILDSATINGAVPGSDRAEHPYDQVEHVRITPQPLSLDELSKLWAAFQTQQRPSTAYQVSVVLIESSQPSRASLPVLTRGEDDRGVSAQPDLIPPYPTLTSIRFPDNQPAARLGENLVLVGHHLDADSVTVRCTNRRLEVTNELTIAAGGSGEEIGVSLPDEPAAWPAGFYVVEVVIHRAGEPDRMTNALSFALAPRITLPAGPIARSNGGVDLSLDCVPQIREGQLVALLFAAREIAPKSISTPANPGPPPPDTDPTAPTSLEFHISDVEPGEYWVRLRVDGVDSLLIDRSATPPRFDESQKVTVT